MCVQQKKNQDNQYKLRLYDEKKMFLEYFFPPNVKIIIEIFQFIKVTKQIAYIGSSLKKDNIEKSEQVLLPGHSLSLLQRLYSGLHSQSVIMVDTGHVPGFCRLGRVGPRRAHA